MTDTNMTHVPYAGSGQSFPSVIAGETQLTFANMLQAMPLVKAGRLKALGVTSNQRSWAAPEVPTIAESGFPDFEAITWYGALAPAKTPREIVALLSAEITRIMNTPEVKAQLFTLGVDSMGGSPAQFSVYIRDESHRLPAGVI